MTPKLPLPRGWKRRVRSSVLRILALGHYRLLEQRTFHGAPGPVHRLRPRVYFLKSLRKNYLQQALTRIQNRLPRRFGLSLCGAFVRSFFMTVGLLSGYATP